MPPGIMYPVLVNVQLKNNIMDVSLLSICHSLLECDAASSAELNLWLCVMLYNVQ